MSHRATPTPTCAHDAARGSILARVTATSASAEPMSAQCPACSLHALVPVHLKQLGRTVAAVRAAGRRRDDARHLPGVLRGVARRRGDRRARRRGDRPCFPKNAGRQSANRMCPRGHGFMNEHMLPGCCARRSTAARAAKGCGSTATSGARWPAARPARGPGGQGRAPGQARLDLGRAAADPPPDRGREPRARDPVGRLRDLRPARGLYVLSVEGVLIAHRRAGRRPHRRSTRAARTPCHPRPVPRRLVPPARQPLLFVRVRRQRRAPVRPPRFLLLYVGAGLLGGALQAAADEIANTPVIGASGAIAGVTAAYLWIFPKARLLQTVPIVYVQLKIPAWVYLGIWIGFQVVMATSRTSSSSPGSVTSAASCSGSRSPPGCSAGGVKRSPSRSGSARPRRSSARPPPQDAVRRRPAGRSCRGPDPRGLAYTPPRAMPSDLTSPPPPRRRPARSASSSTAATRSSTCSGSAAWVRCTSRST
jgi:hypothetical protein